MPTPQRKLPDELFGRAFTLEEGLKLGLTFEALRHDRFDRPFRGVRMLAGAERSDASASGEADLVALDANVRGFAGLLRPGESFSHETALLLYGCPIHTKDATIHTTARWPDSSRRGRNVTGHATREAYVQWERGHGVKLVPPCMALAQSAATLGLQEVIVAADRLALPRRGKDPLLDLAQTMEFAATRTLPGSILLRSALGYARIGAESRMETLLRLVLEAFDLAEYFDLQVEVADSDGWIGRFDLVCRKHRVIVEYDGEQHRTNRAQYLKDVTRLDRARAAGYEVIRVHARDLFAGRDALLLRVAEALGVRLQRTPTHPELLGK